jgi:hypothetical protein
MVIVKAGAWEPITANQLVKAIKRKVKVWWFSGTVRNRRFLDFIIELDTLWPRSIHIEFYYRFIRLRQKSMFTRRIPFAEFPFMPIP